MPIIRIEMLTGRTHEQREELAEVLTREMARIARCPAEHVQIVISEYERSHWAVAGALGKPAIAAD